MLLPPFRLARSACLLQHQLARGAKTTTGPVHRPVITDDAIYLELCLNQQLV